MDGSGRNTELVTQGREPQQLVDEIGRQSGDGDFGPGVLRNSLIQLQQPSGKRPGKKKRKMGDGRGKKRRKSRQEETETERVTRRKREETNEERGQ